MNNIIIYRVPESQSRNASERVNDDKRFVEQLLCGLQVGIVPEDIKKVMRLGKVTDDTSRGPRPLLVYLFSRTAKNLVMEGLYKLKSMETKFRSVIIAHSTLWQKLLLFQKCYVLFVITLKNKCYVLFVITFKK